MTLNEAISAKEYPALVRQTAQSYFGDGSYRPLPSRKIEMSNIFQDALATGYNYGFIQSGQQLTGFITSRRPVHIMQPIQRKISRQSFTHALCGNPTLFTTDFRTITGAHYADKSIIGIPLDDALRIYFQATGHGLYYAENLAFDPLLPDDVPYIPQPITSTRSYQQLQGCDQMPHFIDLDAEFRRQHPNFRRYCSRSTNL